MRILFTPLGFKIQYEKLYCLALTKTNKIIFFGEKLEQKQGKNWQFTTAVRAHDKQEAIKEFLEVVKTWRKDEKMREEEKRKSKIYLDV